MNEDGRMARLNDLFKFSKKHKIKLASIEDLISYRLKYEKLIKRLTSKSLIIKKIGRVNVFNYKNKLLFHVNKNTYEICNNKFECKKIDISEKIENEIFQEHEVKYNNDIVKFIRTNKNYFK